jgi:CheY-like chemotaxis protein
MAQKTILIADDDPVIRKLLNQHLTAAGYSVVQAPDGKAAVQLAKAQQPDLVILDIMMPKMDGGDAGQALRDTPSTGHIPLIFLSTLVTAGVSREGEHTMVAKPYDPATLLSVIREQIG